MANEIKPIVPADISAVGAVVGNLMTDLRQSIDEARSHVASTANYELTMMYWHIGERINRDVLGLCKIATIDEISDKNYSLTPGAYVGVAEVEDDGVDFHERMNEIHTELASLNKEASVLMNEIMKEWETLNTK